MVKVLDTERLVLRKLTLNDAAFILSLLNTPSFIKFIGDRKVRTLAEAETYLINGSLRSYSENVFGLWLIELKDSKMPVGICGLIKREGLEDVDIGFALMPAYEGKGYGYEAAAANHELWKNKTWDRKNYRYHNIEKY